MRDPVIISLTHQVIVLVIHRRLRRDHGPIRLRNLRHIQLVAEGARQRHIAPRLKRRIPPNRVIRAVCHVRPHGGQRIYHRRTRLNGKTLHRIRIVRAPDLRAVIEHTRIKSRPAAGTVLQKQMREFPRQSVLQLIHRQYLSVEQLSLSVRRQAAASHIGQLPVHIPLYIFNIRTAQHRCDHIIHTVPHFLSGQIQHILVSGKAPRPARNGKRPVRMFSVQVGIRRYHLRLQPDTEFHPQLIDFVHQIFQAAL